MDDKLRSGGVRRVITALGCRSGALPESKELVSSSSSGSDYDSEVDNKLKRKKQVPSEKPTKKQKT